jgi:hypothetical protein
MSSSSQLFGAVLLGLAIGACASPGCGGGEATSEPATSTATGAATRPVEQPAAPEAPQAHCPPELDNCATASGTIIYIERVDPDGDGDAHFVLSSEEGITFKGVSVVDVAEELRPHPLPKVGDHISAAGPVYTGSYGQSQIEAIELNLAD